MTKAFKYLSYLLVGAACATTIWSCTDEDYTMPAPNITPEELVEGVAFTVEHDAQNPNIIHLKSLMPQQYQIAWVTPQGRKTGPEATLSIPFDGEYEVQMGVDTRGGYVWSNPYSFTIDDFCADFVEHYLWTRISGGVGQSKTWQLDLGVLDDGTVKVTKWKGPHYFFTNTYTWDNLHAANENESVYNNYMDTEKWDANNAITPCSDWYWAADYPGNSWMVNEGADLNFGYITFDLINGANVTVTDHDGNVVGKGTYMLDTEAHTIQFSDVYPLEATDGRTHERFLQLLYLSDDAMQIMAPSEGVSLNYVTKEYFENYTEPKPTVIELPDGWYGAFTTQIKYSDFVLDAEAPFGWYDLGGAAMGADYGIYPIVDATVDEYKINFCSPESGKYMVTIPEGDPLKGNVTISEDGSISLSEGLGDLPLGGSAVKLEGKEFNMISVEVDGDGRVEAFVLGLPEKDVNGTIYQYLGYRFLADYAGAEKKETYKAQLGFNITEVWTGFEGEAVFVEDGGTYTATMDVNWGAGGGDPCLWLDVYKILKNHPNCDIVLNDIKVDGVSISFDDTAISRGEGDDPTTARRYICNPWGLASCFSGFDIFHPNKNVEVTFSVVYENGTSFIPPKKEE